MTKKESESKERRLADKAGVGGEVWFPDVEKVEKAEIDGVEVILVDFKFARSQFKDPDEEHPKGYQFVILLIEVDGEQKQVAIGGQVVVEGLKNVNKYEDLPAPVIFLKEKTKDGKKTFWTMK